MACLFESVGALKDGFIVKEKLIQVYEEFIGTDNTSNKEVWKPLLVKAYEACDSLGMTAGDAVSRTLTLMYYLPHLPNSFTENRMPR